MNIQPENLVLAAAGLISDNAAKSEYNRGVTELVCAALGLPIEERDTVLLCLRNVRQAAQREVTAAVVAHELITFKLSL